MIELCRDGPPGAHVETIDQRGAGSQDLALRRLPEIFLHFAQADGASARLDQTTTDQSLGKEMRFAAAATAPCPLVACRFNEQTADRG
jgi:hypothetical protein